MKGYPSSSRAETHPPPAQRPARHRNRGRPDLHPRLLGASEGQLPGSCTTRPCLRPARVSRPPSPPRPGRAPTSRRAGGSSAGEGGAPVLTSVPPVHARPPRAGGAACTWGGHRDVSGPAKAVPCPRLCPRGRCRGEPLTGRALGPAAQFPISTQGRQRTGFAAAGSRQVSRQGRRTVCRCRLVCAPAGGEAFGADGHHGHAGLNKPSRITCNSLVFKNKSEPASRSLGPEAWAPQIP